MGGGDRNGVFRLQPPGDLAGTILHSADGETGLERGDLIWVVNNAVRSCEGVYTSDFGPWLLGRRTGARAASGVWWTRFQSLRPALWTQPLTSQQLQCIQELSSRRLQRMPVQYILGEWDFQGLSLRMVPPVFIPRPETEELVEWVLEEVAQRSHAVGSPGSPLILEVGCGSGAISLSLLSQLPQSRVIAVDKGEAAISLTHENAQRLRLQDRIWIIHLDMTSERSWTHLPWGPVDLIVSNPPYVFHQDMEQLAPEIRSYEDPAALDGGEEGMDIITHILALAPRLLKDSGSIFLEVDPRHPELVSSWLQSRPDLYLNLVAVRRDFCGRPRFLHIRRSGP
ncbi:MTRF1L release factor glutamine methyltransferase isoform X1 [Pan paniscus]|uniref:MTRF1L release factor glutamine methyltransferase isoform X1 n=2 Tax=Pan paniscus TaxID=9597 RepID=UPI0015610984|nr:MTRF1L release factor glutamine methyltransferase isoform X1 [Pan paniscus]